MSCRTVFSQIQIEVIIFCFQSEFFHSFQKLVVVILTLASTDDLTDTRNQTVHSSYCLAIFVEFHVEGFDLLRIIRYEYRTFEDFFCQITLMLCLQVCTPEYFIIKLVIVFLKDLDRFRIGNMSEIRI